MSAHERTGWRDRALSLRHRQWGFDVPMCDIDFLGCEFDSCQPVAIIDYKKEPKRLIRECPSIKTLVNLADRARIYFFVVSYSKDFSRWRVQPGNEKGRKLCKNWLEVLCTEERYVKFLYMLRGSSVPTHWVQFDEEGKLIVTSCDDQSKMVDSWESP